MADALELAKAMDDHGCLLPDGEQAAGDDDQAKKNQEDEEDWHVGRF